MVSGIVPQEKRGTAFGLFDTGFGMAWFLGSVTMGVLYDTSISALIAFSVTLQLSALPVFVFVPGTSVDRRSCAGKSAS